MALSVELQCLLQSFFSQNAFTEINLRALIAELLHGGQREDVSRETINATIATVNEDISNLDFEIRRTIDQADGTDIWVLCNTTSDPQTQLATAHTQNEIQFFKALLDCIFVKNNTHRAEILAVAHMDAVRCANSSINGSTASINLSKSQAEAALKQFVDEAWLQKSEAGFYTLTARSLMELQGFLRDTYNDEAQDDPETTALKTCFACKEFLTMVVSFQACGFMLTRQGYRCPNLHCVCRFHFKCYDAFFRGSLTCPVCREATWERRSRLYVGERAARRAPADDEDGDSHATRRTNGHTSSTTSRRQDMADGDEEDEDE